ncbi:MAG: hypothetical protein GC129_06135 [Proteobacteria bacterium]|nr:hypothetical protein [Pseudomonadota bacterium]
MRTVVLALLACWAALPALAADTVGDRVVAVVNDQIITLSQLQARTALTLRENGLAQPTAEQRDVVAKRTLAGLIDEELQRQYAADQDILVMPAEVQDAEDHIKEQVGASAWEKTTAGLKKTMDDKVIAELRWQQIMARNIRPQVNVSTAEADRLIAELAKSRHVLERQIAMIMVKPVEGESDAAQAKKMQEMREKILKGAASFSDEAKAYSEDKSAVNGGELGWFAGGELNPELEEALDKMQPGEVSQPIRTPLGWHLVKLENVRTTKPVASTDLVTQMELYFLAAPKVSDTAVMKQRQAELAKAVAAVNTPDGVRGYFNAKQYGKTFEHSIALGWVTPSDLQPDLIGELSNTKPGNWTHEVSVGDDTGYIYVADTQKIVPPQLEAYRAKVMDNLLNNRMELAARKFMRELRQKAFVDVKL